MSFNRVDLFCGCRLAGNTWFICDDHSGRNQSAQSQQLAASQSYADAMLATARQCAGLLGMQDAQVSIVPTSILPKVTCGVPQCFVCSGEVGGSGAK